MANLKSHEQASILGNFVPPGVIMPFAGAAAPAGWLLCDGSEISETTYASLFASISTAYNTQANPVAGGNWSAPSAGNFRVPDYRGLFLRGTGTPSGLDAVSLGGQQVQKTKKNGLAVSGGTASLAGSISVNTGTANIGNDSPDHAHGMNLQISNQSVSAGGVQNIAYSGALGTGGASARHSHSDSGHGHGLTNTLSVSNTAASITDGDNETRPINKGVNYIIKY